MPRLQAVDALEKGVSRQGILKREIVVQGLRVEFLDEIRMGEQGFDFRAEQEVAVRQEGVVELSPMAFFSGLEDSTAAQLLGVAVNSGEIVEMDDGLKHYCFYLDLGGARYLPYWDADKARQNVYQPDSEDD